MAILDGTMANVALPVISAQLSAGAAHSVWLVNAYQLTLIMCMLPLAALGEILGYRRIYLCGLAVSIVASLLAMMASDLFTLTMGRAVECLGPAGVKSVNRDLIRDIVRRDRLGKTIGLNSTVVAMGATLGPTVASLILYVGDS